MYTFDIGYNNNNNIELMNRWLAKVHVVNVIDACGTVLAWLRLIVYVDG